MRPLRLALAVASITALAPSVCRAAGPALHVLEISTEDADDQAKALTLALKSKVKALPDRSLGEGDISLQVILLTLKCGDVPDAACQVKIADKLKTDAYVWGTLRKQPGGQVVADLHLWQRDQPEARQQFTYPESLTSPTAPELVKQADQMIYKLLMFGKIGAARLTLAGGVSGELFVDGKPSGAAVAGQELTLPIGAHRFEVRRDGNVVAAADGKVAAAGVAEISLAPAKASDGAAGPVDGAAGGDKSWKRTAGFVGVGVGGALIAGGLYSMLKVKGANDDAGFSAYRSGFGPNEDACDAAAAGKVSRVPGAASPAEADSVCGSGSRFQTLQYVFFGVGALAAGAGTYLLVTAPKPGASATTARGRAVVTPLVDRTHAGLGVRGSF
ncbi:MAG: hypothetical protein IT374_14210 [Polyangiaceae bacterium]|nr:hypothetical protein [Polyangiaceae bacterium]